MKQLRSTYLYMAVFGLLGMSPIAAAQPRLVVDGTGNGDFKTIQGAINSIGAGTRNCVIFIRNGIYREKIYIEKPGITLEGESRSKTILEASIARDAWRCTHADDWGVATLNVGADDITLKNLTITNRFGFDWTAPVVIDCAADSTGNKKLLRNGHQMALRTLNATRLRAINCHFRAYGGDTVSPWEVDNGLWYFKDCLIEGSVDQYCPRGWAYAENCEFVAHSGTAIIWHDGSKWQDSKTVFRNCRFSGYDSFMLGRYHRDAQFFLIDCQFANNMRDKAIYRVPTSNTIRWGHRVYYYNCHRQSGTDYKWYADNLPDGLTATAITSSWVFGNRWPELGRN